MRLFIISILLSLVALATTDQAPGYEGFDLIWEDTFSGPAGSLPDQSKWIMQDWYKNLNGDFQTYTTSRANQQHTGTGTLVIVPLRDPSAERGWTSGRLESTYTFTPAPGAKTIAEAEIKLGSASKAGKQGVWPAFWLLGDSHRKGTLIWPTCGEIDILENVNGEPKTQGVIHCDKNPGGICNEKNGIAGALDLPDSGRNFHTYTVMIDRTPRDWRQESVSFFVDGVQYHRVTGDRIGNEEVWGKIAHNLVHFILNVAVGGEWPGDPNESTISGIGNAMEVKYVAHYQSQGAGGSRPPSPGSGGYDPIPQPQPEPGPQYPEPPSPHYPYEPAPPVTGPPRPPAPPYSPHDEIPRPPPPPHFPEPQFPGPHGPPYEPPSPEYPSERPPCQRRPKGPKSPFPFDPYDLIPKLPAPHFPYNPEPPTPPHHDPDPGYPENPAFRIHRPVSPNLPDHPPPSIPHIPYLTDPPEFRPGSDGYPPRPGPPIPGHHKRAENLSAVLDDPRPSRPAPVAVDEEQNGPEPFYPNQGGPHPTPAHEVIEAVPEIPPPDFPPYVDDRQPQQPSHAGVPPQTGPPQHADDIQLPGEIPPPTPDYPQGDYYQPQEPSPEIRGDSSSPCPSTAEKGSNWPGVNRRDLSVPSKFNVRGLAASKRNASEPGVVQLSIPNRFKTPNYPTLPLDGTPPTVRSGDFGGVQAEDIHKYLDKNSSEPEVAKRSLPQPPNHSCLPPDGVRPPTVRYDDPSGVQARDIGNHVDEPIPTASTAPDAAEPSDVRPADFCGVKPEDIREHIEQNGPYHIEIPNNSTNASEAVATPTPQLLSVEKRGLVDGKKHSNDLKVDNSCVVPIFGRYIPKVIIENLLDRFGGGKLAKREEEGDCILGSPNFGRCVRSNKKHADVPKKKHANERTKGKKHADKSTKGKKHADKSTEGKKHADKSTKGKKHADKSTKEMEVVEDPCFFRVFGLCILRRFQPPHDKPVKQVRCVLSFLGICIGKKYDVVNPGDPPVL